VVVPTFQVGETIHNFYCLSNQTRIFIYFWSKKKKPNTKSLPHIGICVFKAPGYNGKHILNFLGTDVLARTKFFSSTRVSQSIHLTPSNGPCIIIPSTFSPGELNKFTLTVSDDGTNNITFVPIKQTYEFKSFRGKWTIQTNTAGGCINNKSWLQNPKFALVLEKEAEVRLVLSQPHQKTLQIVGFYVLVFKKHNEGVLSSKHMVGKSEFSESREIQCCLKLPPNVYVILPCTFEAGKEGPFDILLFTEQPCQFVQVPIKSKPENS